MIITINMSYLIVKFEFTVSWALRLQTVIAWLACLVCQAKLGQSYNFRHSRVKFMLVLNGWRKMVVISFVLVLFFNVSFLVCSCQISVCVCVCVLRLTHHRCYHKVGSDGWRNWRTRHSGKQSVATKKRLLMLYLMDALTFYSYRSEKLDCLCNFCWTERKMNCEICEKLGIGKELQRAIQRKLWLFGHICRMEDNGKLKTVMFGIVEGMNKRGRPCRL